MSGEDDKNRDTGVVVGHERHHHSNDYPPPQAPHYGTFEGVANYPPPQQQPPVIGFPQPVPPPGLRDSSAQYYAHGYQSVPGYAVAEGRPVREHRLRCCGLGLGWFLFIIGFLLGSIPWYIGLIILVCGGRIDPREKPGYVACTIAAVIALIAVVFGVTKGAKEW